MSTQTINPKMIDTISSPAYYTDIYCVRSHDSGTWRNVRDDYFVSSSCFEAMRMHRRMFRDRTITQTTVCDVKTIMEMMERPDDYVIYVPDEEVENYSS